MKSEKQHRNAKSKGSQSNVERDELGDDVDALFRLPLAEFTGARNTLAAQLKKSGRSDEAALVKALAKPSISAWAVNQLYWNHRDEFDRLIASGERFHKAQSARGAGNTDMRTALDARREALTHLSDLATSLLQDAGSNPALETIRRITSTLEAMSAYASRSDAPRPGRLTHDVDPPGFESLAAFGSSVGGKQAAGGGKQAAGKVAPKHDVRQLEDTRKAKIADTRVSLQDAKRSLTEARARVRSLEAAQKKSQAEAKEAEKQKREAEERWEQAKAASEDASRRARSVADEVKEAARALADAERTVEKGTKELEAMLRSAS